MSNPRITATRIAERNKHFAHIIVATLPQHLAALRSTHPHVVSILDLLDEVRA
ncbi:MAG TPA: hypothetical protein VF824_10750 [Thermoanaerobaculia bacterium]